jgi:hypothetical protein
MQSDIVARARRWEAEAAARGDAWAAIRIRSLADAVEELQALRQYDPEEDPEDV